MTALTRRLLAPAPPERPATLRILVGGFAVTYLVIRFAHFWQMAGLERHRFEPVGVLGALTSPLPAPLGRGLLVATITFGIAFAAGWRYRVTAPAFAALLLLATTARNSWGQVWHVENLLVLHVIVLAFAPASAARSLDARSAAARSARSPAPAARFGWPARLMSIATVLTYALAGVTKLRDAGLGWAGGELLRNQVAYDNLRKVAFGDASSPFADAFLRHGWLFAPIAALTLAVELGSPLALLNRSYRRVWAATAWLFHAGVLALMAISFPYPLSGVALASLFQVEHLLRPLKRRCVSRGQ